MQTVIRESQVHCDCGEVVTLITGDKLRLNSDGKGRFDFGARKIHANLAAEVVGFCRDGRCIRIRWDGEKTVNVAALSFFHDSPKHEAWARSKDSF